MRKINYKEPSQTLKKMAEPNNSEQRVSVGMESFMNEYYNLPIEKLIPYKNQARVLFDDEELLRLSETVQQHGIRQPLTVMRSTFIEGKFEIISGERRLRAAKLVGLEKVPCIVLEPFEQAEEIALVENIQRSDLHPLELGRALKSLAAKRGWGGQTELQRKLGLSHSQISEFLKLTTLDKELQNVILEKNFRGRDNFRKLFQFKTEEEQRQFVLNDGVSRKTQESKKTPLTTKSLFRLSLTDVGITVQKNALKKLNVEQRKKVKEIFEVVLREL